MVKLLVTIAKNKNTHTIKKMLCYNNTKMPQHDLCIYSLNNVVWFLIKFGFYKTYAINVFFYPYILLTLPRLSEPATC